MAKARSSKKSSGKKRAKKKSSSKSVSRGGAGGTGRAGGGSSTRSSVRADEIDDIMLLNVHRYPDSVPSSVAAQVRNDKGLQRRLEDLIKGLPGGKRGQSNFNQLFQQKLDENPAPPPSTSAPADDSSSSSGREVAPAEYRPAPRQAEPGGIGGFFRKLFS